jgi:hypothetical protein
MGGAIACLQVQDGKILWQHSLTGDFGGTVPPWSYRESPLVDGEKVIYTPGVRRQAPLAIRPGRQPQRHYLYHAALA